MSGPQVGLLAELLKAVARLALPASAQMEYLRQRGLLPSIDELGLEFHDLALLAPQFVANDWLRPQDAVSINELDRLLERMSSGENASLWTVQALETQPEWEEVRDRARAILFG